MDSHEFQDALKNLLSEIRCMDPDDLEHCDLPCDFDGIDNVRTFQEAGVLTSDAGLVVTAADGREWQITILQSR